MGCDIHLYVEHRINGVWESADTWVNGVVPWDKHFYSDRNYALFSILAGVRQRGAGFNMISEPRGLPEDTSAQVRNEAEVWDLDGHTRSWLTVAEIMAFDWTQTTKLGGYVDAAAFADWDGWSRSTGEGPRMYSQGVDGENIKKITEDQMREVLKSGGNTAGLHCWSEWEAPYYKQAGEFLGSVLPRLWRLGAPDDVRIVFWFDN